MFWDDPTLSSGPVPLKALNPGSTGDVEGNPLDGPILRGVKREDGKPKPLNLNWLAREVVRPALRNPKNYRATKEWRPIKWQGFYSLRRGIATHINRDHP